MKRSYTRRAAFTLVELLTVIIIIGFLAGMVAGTAPAVMRSMQESAIRAEIMQLSFALEAYKAEYGEYPPDGTWINRDKARTEDVYRHLLRCYPDLSQDEINAMSAYDVGKEETLVTPQTALFVFLGAHCANPRYLFNGHNNYGETKAFFEFDKSRLVTCNVKSCDRASSVGLFYTPKNCNQYYVYLKARGATGRKSYHASGIIPSYKDSDGNWYNPDTYQIISAGLDDEYGPANESNGVPVISGNFTGISKDGVDRRTGLDNIVNFGKKRIKDLID